MNDHIRFGPSGNSDSFYSEGYKRTAEAPAWLRARGLDAFEYSFGHGVRMGAETAESIRLAALEAGVRMSIHLPYFVNLAAQGEEKRAANIGYFVEGLAAGRAMGATRAVFHPGSGKGERAVVLTRACEFLSDILAALDGQGLLEGMTLCAETMGKVNQLGSLLCLFFAGGKIRSYDDVKYCDLKMYNAYFSGMLERGILLPPAQFECMFLSQAHSETDLEKTVEANYRALAEAREGLAR